MEVNPDNIPDFGSTTPPLRKDSAIAHLWRRNEDVVYVHAGIGAFYSIATLVVLQEALLPGAIDAQVVCIAVGVLVLLHLIAALCSGQGYVFGRWLTGALGILMLTAFPVGTVAGVYLLHKVVNGWEPSRPEPSPW